MYQSIFFVFQPKFRNGLIYGYEALIRADDGINGMVFPSDMMLKHRNDPYFDYFIVNKAIKQVYATPSLFGYNISVNVSANFICSLNHGHFAFDLNSLPFNLELEILENTKIYDFPQADKNMKTLKDQGVKFSSDDFGCDYSSIERLWYLNFEMIKIDRTLIAQIDVCQLKQKRFLALVEYVRANFDVEVLAEGVESYPEYQFLRECGITHFQGFYLGRPSKIHE